MATNVTRPKSIRFLPVGPFKKRNYKTRYDNVYELQISICEQLNQIPPRTITECTKCVPKNGKYVQENGNVSKIL